MGAYTKELRAKTDEELLQELAVEDTFSAGYIKELRQEIKRRKIDPVAAGAKELTIHQRRIYCERCDHHAYEEPGNPLSDVVCKLNGRQNPVFEGKKCPQFSGIEEFEEKTKNKAVLYLVLAVLSIMLTVFLIVHQINSGSDTLWIVLIAPFTLLAYSIHYLRVLHRKD